MFVSNQMFAQTFKTSKTLKEGVFSAGVQPVYLTKNSTSDFMLFGHMGYGLQSGVDLGAKVGFLGDKVDPYFGVDAEFAVRNNISVTGGAHVWNDFGLDFCAIWSDKIANGVELYSGLDFDFNFGNKLYVPVWMPIGIEIYQPKGFSVLLEANVGLSKHAWHMIGGGVNFYF